jgi:hypothetical protein
MAIWPASLLQPFFQHTSPHLQWSAQRGDLQQQRARRLRARQRRRISERDDVDGDDAAVAVAPRLLNTQHIGSGVQFGVWKGLSFRKRGHSIRGGVDVAGHDAAVAVAARLLNTQSGLGVGVGCVCGGVFVLGLRAGTVAFAARLLSTQQRGGSFEVQLGV